jgi:plasmid stabilization system protein ParE
MRVKWTSKAASDLVRHREFLANTNRAAAARVIKSILGAQATLAKNPRIEKLAGFDPREIRRLFVGKYEIRYEIANAAIFVLRDWHTREHR